MVDLGATSEVVLTRFMGATDELDPPDEEIAGALSIIGAFKGLIESSSRFSSFWVVKSRWPEARK